MDLRAAGVIWAVAWIGFGIGGSARAQSVQPRPHRALDTVQVTASVPTPPIWIAKRSGHAVIVMGVIDPVPKSLPWRSARLDHLLGQAQVLVDAPELRLRLGWFGGLGSMATAIRHARYPDHGSLQQHMDPATFAELRQVERRYLPGETDFERDRPSFAADLLMASALKQLGYRRHSPVVGELHHDFSSRHIVELQPVYPTDLERPTAYMRELMEDDDDAMPCLSALADLFDHHVVALQTRAQAWATGDTATLAQMGQPAFDQCRASRFPAALLAQHGVSDIGGHLLAAWRAAVATASADHGLVLAWLPMQDLSDPSPYLQALQAEGFKLHRW